MDEKEKNKEIPPPKGIAEKSAEQAQRQAAAKKTSLAVFLLLALLFIAVTFVTWIFETQFGKTAGTVAMAVIAAVIALYLYREEIAQRIKKTRKHK